MVHVGFLHHGLSFAAQGLMVTAGASVAMLGAVTNDQAAAVLGILVMAGGAGVTIYRNWRRNKLEADQEERRARRTEDVADMEARKADLGVQVQNLSATVLQRDETIKELRASLAITQNILEFANEDIKSLRARLTPPAAAKEGGGS